ncbi:hypothetical protein DFS34DRAFT_619088 [Phlyctochytrium arcticum]|nr:hypothetical protein DFS34DRAFT_619088 [Phlyctochytrium arcticum]
MTRPTSTKTDLPVTSGPMTLAAPTAPSTASKTRHYFGHHPLHHQQSQKLERSDAGIPLLIKHAIIEKCPARLQSYEPREVAIRTEQKFALRETNAGKLEKTKRRADVYRCGFCADAKESYKPLGEPFLDSEQLMNAALRLDPSMIQSANNAGDAQEALNPHEVRSSSRRFRQVGSGPRHNNGFNLIKEKLGKSRGRMNAVKYGIPFTATIDDSAWKYRMDAARSGRTDAQLQEGQVNWHNLKVDTDKQAYFQNLVERELPGLAAKSKRTGLRTATAATRTQEQWGFPRDRHPPQEYPTSADTEPRSTEPNSQQEFPSLPSTPAARQSGLTSKSIEQILNIRRDDSTTVATDQYYTTREHFYEERRRLTQVLLEDLNRMDFEREPNFVRKFKTFKVGKGTMFTDDVSAMRRRADAQRTKEKDRLLRQHPWYNELLNKVVLNGVKREISEYEALLLNRVKCVIEDNLSFTQNTFVQLMKVLPTHEFMQDDIQRIIRFVKTHGNISEREYLEAIEMAGHTYE